MIWHETRLKVADNSGAKEVLCMKIPGGSKKKYATVGEEIICVVKKALPHMGVKKSEVVRGVIVRTKQPVQRKDGTVLLFDDNAVVLINQQGNPHGTRIFGPIARELREKNYMKIVSLAPEVV